MLLSIMNATKAWWGPPAAKAAGFAMPHWFLCRCFGGLTVGRPVTSTQETLLEGSNHGQLLNSNNPYTKVTEGNMLKNSSFA